MSNFGHFLILITLGFSASQAQGATCTVNASGLNIRSKATKNSGVVDSVDRGGTVTCDPTKKNGSWIFVTTSDGKQGWMSLNYMSLKETAVDTTKKYIQVNGAEFVNVRSKPGTDGQILEDLRGTETYPLSTTCNGTEKWYAVDMPGGTCGYVSKRYSETVEQAGPNDDNNNGGDAVHEAPADEVLVDNGGGTTDDTFAGNPLKEQKDPFVLPANYKIRTADGIEMCVAAKGTVLEPIATSVEGEFVKVRFADTKNCKGISEGWIPVNGLRPKNQKMKVATAGSLAMHGTPEGKTTCDVPEGQNVTVVADNPADHQYRAWVKVKLDSALPNCPTEGWVHREHLKLAGTDLDNLPREEVIADNGDAAGDDPEAAVPEGCDGTCGQTIKDLKDVAQGVRKLDDISSWRSHRGLVQIPTKGGNGNIGPCGSFHPNADHYGGGSKVTDNYANPLTACTFMAFMQEWKKRQDAKGGGEYREKGSRLQWGDISDRTRSYFSSHKTHTEGECVDIRPMRNTGFENSAVTYSSGAFSRKLTREMLELAISMGGTPIYFNDPTLREEGLSSYSGGHHNHVHVCFHDNAKTRKTCDNYQYDPNICGGL